MDFQWAMGVFLVAFLFSVIFWLAYGRAEFWGQVEADEIKIARYFAKMKADKRTTKERIRTSKLRRLRRVTRNL